VVCRCVLSRNLENEEAMAHWGLLRKKKYDIHSFIHSFSSLSYDRSKASSKASSPHSAI